MQNSSTMLLALVRTRRIHDLYHLEDAQQQRIVSPSIRLPKLAMKKIELQKQDASLPDWAVMGGDIGVKIYRTVCCPSCEALAAHD